MSTVTEVVFDRSSIYDLNTPYGCLQYLGGNKKLLTPEIEEVLMSNVGTALSFYCGIGERNEELENNILALEEEDLYWAANYALKYINSLVGKRFSKFESLISKEPQTALSYIKKYINGPWQMAEPAIAQSANYSYWYALDILKGRFELGEDAILEDYYKTIQYIRYVIKGRFVKAEEKFLENIYFLEDYIGILSELGVERLEELEETIAKSGPLSYLYARTMLKKPFPLGEKSIILNKDGCAIGYSTKVLNKRWKEAEKTIARYGNMSIYRYISKFGNERLEEFEPFILLDKLNNENLEEVKQYEEKFNIVLKVK